MDKATKVAVEKYPHGKFDLEVGDSLRAACAVGYMQAEKDLALTLEDLRKLHQMLEGSEFLPLDQEGYENVLNRFKKFAD